MFLPISLTQFQNFNQPIDDLFGTGTKLFVTFGSLVIYKEGLWQYLSLNFRTCN